MRFALFTASVPEYSPEDAARLLHQLGYEGIEWRVTDQEPAPDGQPTFWQGNRCTWPLRTFPEDAPQIRALSDRYQLAIPAFGTYVRSDDVVAVEQAMRGCAAAGVSQLRVSTPHYDPATSYREARFAAQRDYARVEALARQYGVRALVEIHFGTITSSPSNTIAFLEGLDPTWGGVIYDPGNMVYEGFEQYRAGLEVLGPYLAHVHLKNAAWRPVGKRGDGSTAWEPSFAPLRDGIVDVAALFSALKQIGYDGWLSFEDFSTGRSREDVLRDNLAYARSVEQATATR
jgi:sugar phosphate isomerase/epimerase